jgi:hypothetical protein
MFSSLTLAFVVCFFVGVAIVLALALKAGAGRNGGATIARVLYDAEHPEKTR